MNEEKVRAEVEEGLRQSAAGEVFDLGSFEEYADEPLTAGDIAVIRGALATIEQMVSIIRRRIDV